MAGRAYFTGPAFPSVDPISAALSTVAVSDGALIEGETMVATLTARRSSGVLLTEPSVSVVFMQGTGTSDGVFSETQDHGNGTYSATYLALTAGTARQIGATIYGVPVTSALPTVTVSAGVAYDTSGAIAPTNRLIAWDDFSTYADTTALLFHFATGNTVGRKYWQCENNSLVSIDPAVTVGGHHTVKAVFPGGGVATTPQPKAFTRNTLNGGPDGTTTPFYPALWRRYRIRFTAGFNLEGTPGSQGGAAWSYKSMAYGWFGGTTGHSSGRSTHEYMGGAASPNTLKVGLQAVGGSLNFTDIALDDDTGNPIGTQWSDEAFYDVVDLLEMDQFAYRLRTWKATTGQVPTKITDLSGTILVTGGHEGDPKVGHETHTLALPRADRLELGANFNRLRTDEISLHWGSWELSNGDLWANPFDLPAVELV